MFDVQNAIATWIVRSLLAGSVLLLAGFLLQRIGKSARWSWQAGVWSIRSAVVATIGCAAPAWLAVIPAFEVPVATVQASAHRTEIVESPDVVEWVSRPISVIEVENEPAEERVELPASMEPVTDAAPAAKFEIDWLGFAIAAYIAVASLLLLQLLIGAASLWRCARGAVPATGCLAELASELSPPGCRWPRVLVSDRVPSPLCFGVIRPTVLLPSGLTERQARWILAHEFDHLKRGDAANAWWIGVARALFFPVPWFWLVRSQLQRGQEYLADAAAGVTDRTGYAEFLLALSERMAVGRFVRPSLSAIGVRSSRSDLFRRIDMLLNRQSLASAPFQRGPKVALAVAFVAAALGASGLGFAQGPPLPAKPEAPSVDDKTAERAKQLTAKIEQAIKDSKADEAKKLLKELTDLQAAPKAEKPQPPVAPLPPPRGDFVFRRPVLPEIAPLGGADVRRDYEKQLKDFEKLIAGAKDEEAREALKKARDEYVKGMEEAVKAADAAKKEIDRAVDRNRIELGRVNELLREQMQKQMEDLRRAFPEMPLVPIDPFAGLDMANLPAFGIPGRQSKPRLGLMLDKIPAVLADQLDLPKSTGVVVADVVEGSPAEKAGVKKNDVLLSFDGKDAPNDPAAVTALAAKKKGGEKIDIVVLRKGKKETIKGIEVPEDKKIERGGSAWNQMQIQINNDAATINATSDGVNYAITGTVTGGKLVPDKITIGDKTYDSLEKVPEADRAKVDELTAKVKGFSFRR